MAITKIFDKDEDADGNEIETYNFDYGAIFVSSSAELVGTTFAISAVDVYGRQNIVQRLPTVSHGFPWFLTSFSRLPTVSHGSPLFPMVSHEQDRKKEQIVNSGL